MNSKILLGSIISVVILILVSFTSVVGYGSVESNVKESPLFNIRSNRAIDKESKDLSCDYLGKGVVTNINIPSRDNGTILTQKVFELISKMDDREFNEFIDFFKNQKFWEHCI